MQNCINYTADDFYLWKYINVHIFQNQTCTQYQTKTFSPILFRSSFLAAIWSGNKIEKTLFLLHNFRLCLEFTLKSSRWTFIFTWVCLCSSLNNNHNLNSIKQTFDYDSNLFCMTRHDDKNDSIENSKKKKLMKLFHFDWIENVRKFFLLFKMKKKKWIIIIFYWNALYSWFIYWKWHENEAAVEKLFMIVYECHWHVIKIAQIKSN